MELFDGLDIELEHKGYRIELEKSLNGGVRINFRRDIGGRTKDHGTMCLDMKDVDKLIEGLQYMKENI